ncbi:MAG: hypothetical protein M0P91_06570 [Sulfuricurvum sp.]|uniref:hypothetical protein n=1 Tax=Sulfuricurvum sp. TaxID=2025608 RepID=UPI0025FEEBF3|nr:hypothetical protein [Sulfuricurvum sp.]MCK9372843.1 hypothetical protein [Sulfuricurvum sp.]
MLSSFFTRLTSSQPQQHHQPETAANLVLETFVRNEGGEIYSDFHLFHNNNITPIHLLIFLPNFGIFLGERISWHPSELKNATVQRASRQIKRPSATRFEAIESRVRRKLEDVLSFDTTPIYRFIWLQNITEKEFDTLDPSFHQFLPKSHLLFSDETPESVQTKVYAIGDYQSEPYSFLKIIGALNSHTLILPSPLNPSGALLTPQQNLFLASRFQGVTTLSGGEGSGKSTLLIRKALSLLLANPQERIMIITPTRLGGELLRNELISLLEYGAVRIDIGALSFYTPYCSNADNNNRIEDLKGFQDASIILCDDSHLLEAHLLQKLQHHQTKRWLLMSTILPVLNETAFTLSDHFRHLITPKLIYSKESRLLLTLLIHVRRQLLSSIPSELLIIVPSQEVLNTVKEAIDTYFHLNCRPITLSSSLQYQDLDSIIIATTDAIAPLCREHVLLLGCDPMDPNYSIALSRASESLTIITDKNSIRKDISDENYEN